MLLQDGTDLNWEWEYTYAQFTPARESRPIRIRVHDLFARQERQFHAHILFAVRLAAIPPADVGATASRNDTKGFDAVIATCATRRVCPELR